MKIALFLLCLPLAVDAQKLHELCGACHSEPASDFQTHKHFEKGLECDACHGESKPHREATGHKPPDRVAGPAEQAQVCGACHAVQSKLYAASKHGQLVAAHQKAAACTTCHGVHALRAPAAMQAQCNRCHPSLPAACRKQPAACVTCHNPHTLAKRTP